MKNEKTESLSIGLLSTIIGLLWDARLCNCVLKDESLSKTINQESLFFLKHAKKMPLKELKRLILLRLPNTIFQKISNKKSIRKYYNEQPSNNLFA